MAACPNCGAESPGGKRFCGDCGAPLSANCATCGAENPPEKRFCGDCGAPLARAATTAPGSAATPPLATPLAERRLVTVVFADVVGFTEQAGGLFAEAREIFGRLEAKPWLERVDAAEVAGAVEVAAGSAVLGHGHAGA